MIHNYYLPKKTQYAHLLKDVEIEKNKVNMLHLISLPIKEMTLAQKQRENRLSCFSSKHCVYLQVPAPPCKS